MPNKVELIFSAINDSKKAFADMSREFQGLRDDLKQSGRHFDEFWQKGRGAVSGVSDSLGDLKNALAATGIVMAIKSLVDAAKQVERANIGLATTARYAGVGMQEARDAARDLTKDGLMSVAEASQALQNLLSRGFSLPEAIELMNRFKDSAAFNRQASLEFGYAIVSATEGLKNENSILVDNAGVTKNVSLMWKEYAREHGKTVEQLTQAEKRQAEYNGILKETEGQLGNAARMTETFAGQQARLNQELFEFKATAGAELMPVLADIANGLRPIISLMRDFIGGFEMAAVTYAAWGDKVAAVRRNLGVLPQLGILDADRRAGLKKDWGIIDQAAEAQKQDIYRRLSGGVLPDIGKDSGKRRSDAVFPAKASAKKGRASKSEDLPSAYAMLVKDAAAFAKAWEADQKQLREDAEWISDQRNSYAEAVAKALQDEEELQVASLQHKLTLVDTAAAYRDISRAEAAEQRLALYREMLFHQEKLVDLTGKDAQAIDDLRAKVRAAAAEVRAASQDFSSGFSEGLALYREEIPSLFEQGRDAAHAFQQDLENSFADLFDNILRGKISSWADFFTYIGNQILSLLSEIMAKMTMASLTGKEGGWGDAISGIVSAVGSMWGGGSGVDVDTWGGIAGGLMSNAKGGVYASPSLSRYSGSVVNRPTLFTFAYGGALGVMGEGTDPEGIFPLARDRGGKLGVRAVGGGGSSPTIHLHINAIDTQSGVQFLLKNSDAIMAGIASKMGDNHPLRRGR
jgi:lambda family phage tail tape measure protein